MKLNLSMHLNQNSNAQSGLRSSTFALAICAALSLVACGGGDGFSQPGGTTGKSSYTIGGTVSGLTTSGLVLHKNGGDALKVAANSNSFSFVTPVIINDGYAITIATQPTGQTCTVSNASGAGVTANVSNVAVTCSTNTYSIGGSLSGLADGQQVMLANNADMAQAETISANGGFSFKAPVAYNAGYAVTVAKQPTGQTCSVANASGAGVIANVSNVAVTCSTNTYTISGTISGLVSGQQVTLFNNADTANAATVTVNGSFSFKVPVAYNGGYAVTIGTQPTGQTCSVANASGAGVTADVSNVAVTCSTNTYTIGGTISGLVSGQQVTLLNNGDTANAATVNKNGTFSFNAPVTFNGGYAVTIGTQPTGQTCSVANASGASVTANISNVVVTCSTNTYTIGGTITGLTSGQQVTLLNNGDTANAATVNKNGTFSFNIPVTYNGAYAVTIGTQPTGQTCSVANASGAGVTANISSVAVTCSTNTYTIGGTVSGLASAQQVTLLNNGDTANAMTVNKNGTFSFTAPVTFNGGYAVTIGTQPTGQTCSVANASGAGVTANISNVAVTCSTNTYTIGGTISGLASGQQVTLINNGDTTNAATVNKNGIFSFAVPVTYNGAYAVTVGTQPTGQTCSVANASGAGVTANISNVAVTCSSASTYTIGGTVSGLASAQQVTLLNNGDTANAATVTANGTFSFSIPVANNGTYAVTVGTQPTGQTCSVANASGIGVTANVNSVAVTCSTNTYTIGGTVSGLASGQQVTLLNNGDTANAATVTANGAFSFSTPVTYNGAYAVTVGTQPTAQTCSVANASGTGVTANINNVSVSCVNSGSSGGSATANTLAGSGTAGSTDGVGAAATFNSPTGITSDGSNLYVADYTNNKIRKIVIATGAVSTLAGSGSSGTTNGSGTAASFNRPMGITNDGTNLYVSDWQGYKIRKIVIATGVVSTLAGSGSSGFADGVGTAAMFSGPAGLATDGTNLYVADNNTHRIRKIVIATGAVSTFAGSGTSGASDGTGVAATFKNPIGMTTDGNNLYVTERNHKIRKIVIATAVVSTLAGNGTPASTDGTGTAASFNSPVGISTDGINLYVADQLSYKIRKVVIATGVVSTIAGSGTPGSAEGVGAAASFNLPNSTAWVGGTVFVSDMSNNKIRALQ
ncbi:hypothetical protein [Undibacterium rugosum]|uniref:hypothetical protein n=1 Tax=Undibacterium rugosum TaxID=2762291 RepID=UPI001B820732|nr:hypothetical protein [Undibacterium rugosum]MBR7780229.1 hypothetical protein [Undibacterium rugosum]